MSVAALVRKDASDDPLPTLVRSDVIEAMLDVAIGAPDGAFAEFGVYRGGTAWWLAQAARMQGRRLWLFDTFTGIPVKDAIDFHKVGDFGDTSLEQVKAALPDAIIVPGVFPQSIADRELPSFAFVHVDADQYRSVRAACQVFGPRMVPGGVIWFDDYACSTTPGATAAVDELFPQRILVAGRAMVRFP